MMKVSNKNKKRIRLGSKFIGEGEPVFIIAEAGVSHFGDVKKAKRLIKMAAEAGADAVKFQVYKTENFISEKEAPKWFKRMKSKELSHNEFRQLKDYCDTLGIIFLATAHDEESLDFLDTLGVYLYKIGSGEISNWPFLARVASRGKPVILSTGMYRLQDIGKALNILFKEKNSNIIVLHCITRYPARPDEVNLRVMDTISNRYEVLVGYSDHTQGFHFPLAAVARGACVIEKHITLDFNIPDAQDWKVSCGPEDFCVMVKQIREIENGLGSGIKVPSDDEQMSLSWARKSLVAAIDISAGDLITCEKICAKRPGIGIAPFKIKQVVGRKARVKIKKDTLIREQQLA